MTTKTFEPGDGATICYWTDRKACTVTAATERTVSVREDKAIREDENGMSECQSYRYEPNPNGGKHTFTRRKDGRWVRRGEPMKTGTRLVPGRNHYYDYSF